MNESEIRAMEAGRELDALVAEKVMGWERHGNETDGLWIVPPEDDERRVWCAQWDNRGIPDWMPHYSTDIATAWEVVEKMIELKTFINIGHGGILWRVNISSRHMYERLEYMGVTAMAAPLAICRAALLAVMGQGE